MAQLKSIVVITGCTNLEEIIILEVTEIAKNDMPSLMRIRSYKILKRVEVNSMQGEGRVDVFGKFNQH